MNGDSWDNVAMIFRERIVCPHCHSTAKPIHIRRMPIETDGSYVTRYVCSACSRRFKVASELPEIEKPFSAFD